MQRSFSPGTDVRRVFAGASAGPWTALVTSSFVALARATGDDSWVPRGERVWATGLLRTWGVRVDVVGAARIPRSGPYVIMSNHSSHADVPILFATLPLVPGFIAKKELSRIPFLSMALRAGGHVLIDRADHQSGMQGIKLAAREVQAGKTIAVFPEGTRGDGATLLPFKKGAFLIAKRAGVPIIPVGIRGSHAVLRRGEILPHAMGVSVHIGEPVSQSDAKTLTVDDLCTRVRTDIATLAGLAIAEREVALNQPS
jgi:1-acyl-sn-glycerol-3-phosphate acyltransferase